MYLLSLCALTLWPFLPVSEAMWPKPVRKMDTERMKSVTKKEIERALFPLPYGTYRPLQIDCATWNYHILWQNPSKKTVTWWGSTGKWVYSNLDEDQKREVIAKKGTEKKELTGRQVSQRHKKSTSFICVLLLSRCKIDCGKKMWTDYTVIPALSPFEWI